MLAGSDWLAPGAPEAFASAAFIAFWELLLIISGCFWSFWAGFSSSSLVPGSSFLQLAAPSWLEMLGLRVGFSDMVAWWVFWPLLSWMFYCCCWIICREDAPDAILIWNWLFSMFWSLKHSMIQSLIPLLSLLSLLKFELMDCRASESGPLFEVLSGEAVT